MNGGDSGEGAFGSETTSHRDEDVVGFCLSGAWLVSNNHWLI